MNYYININGSKNASIPIICACLLSKGKYNLSNIPQISDITNLYKILYKLNVNIVIDKNNLLIDTTNIILPNKIDYNNINNFRGSYYIIGSLYYLIKDNYSFELSNGCNIGNRKINYHIDILRKMGNNISFNNNLLILTKNDIKNTNKNFSYTFKKSSVGGTINAILLNVISSNIVILNNVSKDPNVIDVISFLKKMGANIIINDTSIKIFGKKKLNAVNYKVIYDPIEMGSYIILSSILSYKKSEKRVLIDKIIPSILGNFYKILEDIGIFISKVFENNNTCYKIECNGIVNKNLLLINLDIFPKIYTDLQPFLSLYFLEINKNMYIQDKIWNNRFKYVKELKKIGYLITVINNKLIYLNGIKKYNKITNINNYDLRADAAILMALYFSNNIDVIYNINLKYVNRGYEHLYNNIIKLIN